MKKRIKVFIFGLFPSVFSICIPRMDFLSRPCKPVDVDGQLKEYPVDIVEHQLVLRDILSVLSNYPQYVDVEIVSADSLKGIVLSIRYNLGLEMAVIIDGRVFRGEDLDLEKIEKYINEIIASHGY
jgi:hypothetical protein